MLEAFTQGALLAMAWPALGYLLLGVGIGIWLGAVPGLGGALGIVLVLPFTYGMDPVPAFSLLLGIYTVTATSDTIASVMLGIPGTASSQATVLDGHPLARRGEAARAFGAAFTVSAFGGVFGAIILAVSLPIALPVILSFNNPELFSLAILGIVMVGSLSGTSLVKGLAAACFGLWLSTIGYADDVAVPRYWMGQTYLLEALPLVPFVLGIFAVPDLIDLAVRDKKISAVPKTQGGTALLFEGVRDAFTNWWLALRCSAIGVYIGMIPGLGGAVVDWIAYGHALQSSKDTSQFGKGDIRGVIGPEAANNAVRGGSLIPTVAFGVPGSAINALLLSALLIQGLQPGAQMLTTNLPITFSMVWTIAIANLVAAGLLMLLSNQIAKMAFVSAHWIVPGVMLFVFMGAWLSTANLGDWVTLIVFGALGYAMKQGGWPRPPIVLAFILGGLMENSFILSFKIYEGMSWVTRPIAATILIIAVLTILYSWRRQRRNTQADAAGEAPMGAREVDEEDRGISVVIGLGLMVLLIAALVIATGWSPLVAAFPLIALVPGILLAAWAIAGDVLTLRRDGGIARAMRQSTATPINRRAALFVALLVGAVGLSLLIGQKLALPLALWLYLLAWGRVRMAGATIYALAAWIILVGFYDRVVHVFWLKPLLRDPIIAITPDWLPLWLVL